MCPGHKRQRHAVPHINDGSGQSTPTFLCPTCETSACFDDDRADLGAFASMSDDERLAWLRGVA